MDVVGRECLASNMVAGEAGSRMSSSRVAQPRRPITRLFLLVARIVTRQATNRKDAAGGNLDETSDAASSYPLMRSRSELCRLMHADGGLRDNCTGPL